MDEYVRTKIYAEYVAVGDLIKVQAGMWADSFHTVVKVTDISHLFPDDPKTVLEFTLEGGISVSHSPKETIEIFRQV